MERRKMNDQMNVKTEPESDSREKTTENLESCSTSVTAFSGFLSTFFVCVGII